jgi:muconolactone delta-isomerase
LADDDSIPGLLRSLPDWEAVFDKAVLAKSHEPLKAECGNRAIIDLIDFTGGTEGVTAPYDEGQLLIIEYPTPQASVAADAAFIERLAAEGDRSTVYRRIGNFNVFVFNVVDTESANALLDRVRYDKTVQWLGKDPNIAQKTQRYIALSAADLFISTVKAIVFGFGVAVVVGIITGLFVFRFRDRRQASMPTFSDAGGMVRLNLDGLTSAGEAERLLDD